MTEKEYLIDCIRRIQLDYQKQIDPYIKRLASLYEPQSYIVGVTRFNGAIPDELQPDKTVEFLMTQAIKTEDFPAVKASREIVEKQAQRYFDMMKGN